MTRTMAMACGDTRTAKMVTDVNNNNDNKGKMPAQRQATRAAIAIVTTAKTHVH